MKIRVSTPSSRGNEINIIPLLDVVFAVLAVFMLLVAELSVPQSIGVDLPSRSDRPSSKNNPQPDLLVLTLDSQGNLFLADSPISGLKLEEAIANFLSQKPDGLVVLNAQDRSVSYQQVINRLAELRKLAGDRVAIATSVSDINESADKFKDSLNK
jgi:biopolymer transport protein ExbD